MDIRHVRTIPLPVTADFYGLSKNLMEDLAIDLSQVVCRLAPSHANHRDYSRDRTDLTWHTWDISTGDKCMSWLSKQNFTKVELSQRGLFIGTYKDETGLSVLDSATGNEVFRVPDIKGEYDSRVRPSHCFSADGTLLAVNRSYYDSGHNSPVTECYLHVYDCQSGNCIHRQEIVRQEFWKLLGVANSGLLVYMSSDLQKTQAETEYKKTIVLYDLRRKEKMTGPPALSRRSDFVAAVNIDRGRLVTQQYEYPFENRTGGIRIQVWSLFDDTPLFDHIPAETIPPLGALRHNACSVALSPDGEVLLLFLHNQRLLRGWHIVSGQELFEYPINTTETRNVDWHIAFSLDGRYLAARSLRELIILKIT